MKLIYTHHNPMLVGLVKGQLENEGIRVELKNDMAAGGAGELAPTDCWPEVWVARDRDFARAQQIIEQLEQPLKEQCWQCARCGEENESTFDVCWKCEKPRPPHPIQ